MNEENILIFNELQFQTNEKWLVKIKKQQQQQQNKQTNLRRISFIGFAYEWC